MMAHLVVTLYLGEWQKLISILLLASSKNRRRFGKSLSAQSTIQTILTLIQSYFRLARSSTKVPQDQKFRDVNTTAVPIQRFQLDAVVGQ